MTPTPDLPPEVHDVWTLKELVWLAGGVIASSVTVAFGTALAVVKRTNIKFDQVSVDIGKVAEDLKGCQGAHPSGKLFEKQAEMTHGQIEDVKKVQGVMFEKIDNTDKNVAQIFRIIDSRKGTSTTNKERRREGEHGRPD